MLQGAMLIGSGEGRQAFPIKASCRLADPGITPSDGVDWQLVWRRKAKLVSGSAGIKEARISGGEQWNVSTIRADFTG